MDLLRKNINRIPLLVYWPLLFILTHIPQSTMPGWSKHFDVLDKLIHLFLFAVLAVFFWLATAKPRRAVVLLTLFLVLVVYAALDEWTQSFVGRYSDLLDFAANVIGAAIGLILVSLPST